MKLKPYILCVDDEPVVLETLRTVLKEKFSDVCFLETAESGDEAIEIIEELKSRNQELALVISDYLMPNMKGDELLIRIHRLDPESLKIMLTGQTDVTGVANAINKASLYRFLPKPWMNEDLILTVTEALKSFDNLKKLKEQNLLLEEQNRILEQRVTERTAELNSSLQIIRKDLSFARRIQNGLIPGKNISFGNLDCHCIYHPMEEVGGDIFDIVQISENKIRVFIADAAGHGVQAALVTMLIKSAFEALKEKHQTPQEVLNSLNELFCRKYSSINTFFTCFIADIDIINKKIMYASAAHPYQILIHNGVIIRLERTGRIPGLNLHAEFRQKEYTFNKGDRLILYTDGLFEEFDQNFEQFGEERLEEILLKSHSRSSMEIQTRILDSLHSFLHNKKLQDDLTMIIMELK